MADPIPIEIKKLGIRTYGELAVVGGVVLFLGYGAYQLVFGNKPPPPPPCNCDPGFYCDEGGECVPDVPPPGDTIAPVLNITSPVRGAVLNPANSLQVRGTASDNIAVTSVAGRRKQPAPSTTGDRFVEGTLAADGTFLINLPPASDPSYTAIYARALDAVGNVGRDTVNVSYGTAPPPPPPPGGTFDWFAMDVRNVSVFHLMLADQTGGTYFGEYVKANSALIGDQVNAMRATLQRVGLAAGDVRFVVVDANFNVKYNFGTVRAEDIPTDPTDVSVWNPNFKYTIALDDRICVRYTSGQPNATIKIGRTSDVFNGLNSVKIHYGISPAEPTLQKWRPAADQDASISLGVKV